MVDTPRAHEQQLPLFNARAAVQDELIADIEARREIGIKTYGTALQPFNGRDAGQDLHEELLDAAVYAKQLALESRDMRAALRDVLALTHDSARDDFPFINAEEVEEVLKHHGITL